MRRWEPQITGSGYLFHRREPRPVTGDLSENEVEELREVASVFAYAGCVWWFVFALVSAYWATGGTTGVWTLWGGSGELAGTREPWVVTLLRVTAVVKLVPAVLALVLARQWTRYVPGWMVNVSAFLIGLTLVPSVAVDTALRGLVLVGVLGSAGVDQAVLAWRLLFWNPWWVVGVLLFCAAAWLSQYTLDQPATEADASA